MPKKPIYSFSDKLCIAFDQSLRLLTGSSDRQGRPYPAKQQTESILSKEQKKLSACLMRVNHAGEVCAQGLYHGQALSSNNLTSKLHEAALEEGDHLAWCQERLKELESHTSYLTPFWYFSSLMIGYVAGLLGDAWSLGFLAETEKQVVEHLTNQLHSLPENDKKSNLILKQMQIDENQHGQEAKKLGAKELPKFIKKGMNWTSKIMVKTAYWI